MSSGGGGQSTSTTSTGLPPYLQPYAKQYISALAGTALPGGSVAPYNPAMNQQVAPFSSAQNQALQLGQSLTPQAQSLANQGAATNNAFASGAFTGPNPFLNQYYNQAAQQDVMNYQMATQPALAAQFQQAGAFNSSGYDQAQGYNQYGLGQSLATLGANIYEPAYQQGMANQLNAAQATPGLVSGLYAPTANLYGLGSAQQQQQQNVLNAGTQNAMQQANWPYAVLNQLGAGLGLASGGGGTTISTGPQPTGGK